MSAGPGGKGCSGMNWLLVLLSGSIGAISEFILGFLRELWRNERERRGLLRLLQAEIEHNIEVVRTVRESRPGLLGSPDLRFMKIETWRATRTRATQLLPDELLRHRKLLFFA